MADLLPSAVDPASGEDWTALKFLQAVRTDLQVLKAAAGGGAPSVPAVSLFASAVDATTVRVSWATARTDVTGWMVYRDGLDSLGEVFDPQSLAADARSFDFEDLVAGMPYTVSLLPLLANGIVLPTVYATFVLGPGVPGDPPADVTATTEVVSSSSVRVDWVTDRTDITGWTVGRDGVDSKGSGAWSTSKGAGDRTHQFNLLIPGTTYTFTLTPLTVDGPLASVAVQRDTADTGGVGSVSIVQQAKGFVTSTGAANYTAALPAAPGAEHLVISVTSLNKNAEAVSAGLPFAVRDSYINASVSVALADAVGGQSCVWTKAKQTAVWGAYETDLVNAVFRTAAQFPDPATDTSGSEIAGDLGALGYNGVVFAAVAVDSSWDSSVPAVAGTWPQGAGSISWTNGYATLDVVQSSSVEGDVVNGAAFVLGYKILTDVDRSTATVCSWNSGVLDQSGMILSAYQVGGSDGPPPDPDPDPDPDPGGEEPPPGGSGTEAAVRNGWGLPDPTKSDSFSGSSPNLSLWQQPGDPGTGWPGHDGNGRRMPECTTIVNGILTMRGKTNGDTGWLRHRNEFHYGRYEIRSRSRNVGSSGNKYHCLHLIWPSSGQWPEDGEYDWLEYTDPDQQSAEAWLHYPHPDNVAVQQIHFEKSGVDMRQWHNFAFEWTASGIKTWIDGEPWYTSTGGGGPNGRRNIQTMPGGNLTIQLDNFHGSGMREALFEVDWVKYYPIR